MNIGNINMIIINYKFISKNNRSFKYILFIV